MLFLFSISEQLFRNLTSHLSNGGRLTVAHGASRENIIKCHSVDAESISKILPTAEELRKLMNKFVAVDVSVSDDEKYIVTGVKK